MIQKKLDEALKITKERMVELTKFSHEVAKKSDKGELKKQSEIIEALIVEAKNRNELAYLAMHTGLHMGLDAALDIVMDKVGDIFNHTVIKVGVVKNGKKSFFQRLFS